MTKRIISALFLLLACAPAWGAIGHDTQGEGACAATTCATGSMTIAANSSRAIVCFAGCEDGVVGDRDVTGISCNTSEALTMVAGIENGNDNLEAGVILGPSAGSYVCTATFSGNCFDASIICSSDYNVAQTGQPDASPTTTTANNAATSLAITTATNGSIIYHAGFWASALSLYSSSGTGQTHINDILGGSASSVLAADFEVKATAGAETESITSTTTSQNAQINLAYKPQVSSQLIMVGGDD